VLHRPGHLPQSTFQNVDSSVESLAELLSGLRTQPKEDALSTERGAGLIESCL
jgi:hypothetical protein